MLWQQLLKISTQLVQLLLLISISTLNGTAVSRCDPVTLTFDLIFIGRTGIVMDYPCAKFGDFSFSRFDFIVTHTHTHTNRITEFSQSTDLVSEKGKSKVSWLISIHSLIRQCFNIMIRLCNPSRIRNIKIEQSKQLYHNNTPPLFSPLPKLGQWCDVSWPRESQTVSVSKDGSLGQLPSWHSLT